MSYYLSGYKLYVVMIVSLPKLGSAFYTIDVGHPGNGIICFKTELPPLIYR